MSNDRIAELAALVASGGPETWSVADKRGDYTEIHAGDYLIAHSVLQKDAAIAVALRNAAPTLIAVAKAAQSYLRGHSGADGVALQAALARLGGEA